MNKIQSKTTVDMAPGESRLLTAWFGPLIGYDNDGTWVASDTLTGTPTVVKKSGTSTPTLGTPTVNTSATIDVGGETRAISTCVQFRVTLASDFTPGDYLITCTATTTGGDTLKMDCFLRVWE